MPSISRSTRKKLKSKIFAHSDFASCAQVHAFPCSLDFRSDNHAILIIVLSKQAIPSNSTFGFLTVYDFIYQINITKSVQNIKNLIFQLTLHTKLKR